MTTVATFDIISIVINKHKQKSMKTLVLRIEVNTDEVPRRQFRVYDNNAEVESPELRRVAKVFFREWKKEKEAPTCPRCEQRYEIGKHSLSRRNNDKICPDCGVAEALQDWLNS